jgi:psiF repeat-containing protein
MPSLARAKQSRAVDLLLLGTRTQERSLALLLGRRSVRERSIAMRASILAILLTGLIATAGPVWAQSKEPSARSAASMECSKQADEKGLHGKARKSFRSKCLKSAKRNKSA